MEQYQRYCLANFKDQFVFCIAQAQTRRCCLARHIWENVPITPGLDRDSSYQGACSLGEKVYAFRRYQYYPESYQNYIDVLHNPSASSFCLQQLMHWEKIALPVDVCEGRQGVSFVPLNSTEIAMLGGQYRFAVSDFVPNVITFNTNTAQFKKEAQGEGRTDFYTYVN